MTRELAFWCTDSVNWRIFSFSSSTVFMGWAPLAPSGAASGISSCMGMWSSSLPGMPCQTGVLILPKAFLKPGPQKRTLDKVNQSCGTSSVPSCAFSQRSSSDRFSLTLSEVCTKNSVMSLSYFHALALGRCQLTKVGKSYLSLHKLSSILQACTAQT